jgi:hypothetical protein
MIYIKEKFVNDNLVEILLDRVLDPESITVLKNVCERHLENNKRVLLNLEGLLHISRSGRDFLRAIQNKVTIGKHPQLLSLEG